MEDPPEGVPYLVMEYVDGETLHDRVERKKDERLTPREAAEIVRQVAEGLSAAHQQDLVHRDVKSTNILLDRISGRAKIADFGLARNIQLPPEITRQGEVSGTPEFMSREQILTPELVDARSDVYGLGVVLYHALTGELPFRGTLLGVLRQVLEDEPVAALPSQRRDPSRSGNHLSQVPGKRSTAALCQRRRAGRGSPTLPGRRADPSEATGVCAASRTRWFDATLHGLRRSLSAWSRSACPV